MPRRGYRIQPRVSTLGNIQKKRFALKGREITWAKCVRLLPKGRGYLLGRYNLLLAKLMRTSTKWSDCGPWIICSSRLFLIRLIWRPFRARRPGGRFPGLKPWAESCSRSGARTPFNFSAVQPEFVVSGSSALPFSKCEAGYLTYNKISQSLIRSCRPP